MGSISIAVLSRRFRTVQVVLPSGFSHVHREHGWVCRSLTIKTFGILDSITEKAWFWARETGGIGHGSHISAHAMSDETTPDDLSRLRQSQMTGENTK